MPHLTPLTAAVTAGAALVLLLVAVALGLLIALGRAGRRTDQLVTAVCDLAARLPDQPAPDVRRPQPHRAAVARHDGARTRYDIHRIDREG